MAIRERWLPEELAAVDRHGADFAAFAHESRRHGWPERTKNQWYQQYWKRARGDGMVSAARETALARMHAQADRRLGMGDPPDDGEPTTDDLDDEAFERLVSAYKEVRQATNALDRTNREAHWTAPDGLPTGICFIGDVHAGGNFEMELFERDLGIVRDTDGLHTVFMGDMLDNFKPQAKSGAGLYHALFGDPNGQVRYVYSRALWVRPKLRALLGGNHEGFDGRWAGIDRLPELAKRLGTTYFTEAGGSLFVTVGSQRYHIICKHDFQGKSKINRGNSARRLWDEWPWSFENADAVVLAHLHEPHEEQPIRKGQKVAYLRCGTYKLRDGWAESNGYRPAYGVPLLVMLPHERRIIPFHGEDFLEGVSFLTMLRQTYASDN